MLIAQGAANWMKLHLINVVFMINVHRRQCPAHRALFTAHCSGDQRFQESLRSFNVEFFYE
jgi:hypothetical protein